MQVSAWRPWAALAMVLSVAVAGCSSDTDTSGDGATGADGTTVSTDGTDGLTGTDGATGTDGVTGTDGATGTDGVTGTDGTSATDGSTGTDGVSATDGMTGTDGTDASDGTDGVDGFTAINCADECGPIGAAECVEAGLRVCVIDDDDDLCQEWTTPEPCAGGTVCSAGKCQGDCEDECTLTGATQCAGGGVQTCVDANNDGCREWTDAQACPAETVCVSGVCQQECVGECTSVGLTRCAGGGVQTCTELPGVAAGAGCLVWSDTVPCDSGETCSSGTCSTECTDECTTQGATSCSGNGVRTCGQFDADTCLDWSTPLACPTGETCSAGACSAACQDECTTDGATQCNAGQVETCGNFDGDACLEWSTPAACPAGETCSGGVCGAECQNECTETGATTCSGNGVQKCGDFDADACLEWSTAVACEAGETCSAGACSPECTDECTQTDLTKCSGNGVQTCGNHDADSCLEWSTAVACGAGESCSGGSCAQTCQNECSVDGATSCEANGVRTCGNHDADSCLEWGTPVACPAGQTCSAGLCAEGCLDECELEQTTCSGNAVQTCGDFDSDPCLEFGTPAPCPAGESCSAGVCGTSCVDECDEEGVPACLGTLFTETCGNHDDDECLEWGTPVFCGLGQTCTDGACMPTDGDLTCDEVLSCLSGCEDDAVCEVDCYNNGTTSAQSDFDGFNGCLADHGCTSAACSAWFCADAMTACLYPESGTETCVDIIDCLDGCANTPGCADACVSAASADAQADYLTTVGCLTAACPDGGATCGAQATDSGGLCSAEFAMCVFPDDTGDACHDVLTCTASCAPEDTECPSNCKAAGTAVAQAEYDEFLVCAALSECDDSVCLAENCTFEWTMCQSDGAGTGSCSELVDCLGSCAIGDVSCFDACEAATDLQEQMIHGGLSLCLTGTCPDGDPGCQSDALQTVCSGWLAACFQ